MAAKKILLVEDDNNLREIYGARLQAEGYDIVSAPDGENALAVAVKEKPDLIISDIMMPKVSGFDMLDILRNAPETKDTRIIMMTALSQAEDKARADKLGADMYLVKSQVTLEDVTKAVHSILDDPSEATQEADSAAAQAMVSGQGQSQEEPKADKPEEKPAPQPEPVAEPPAVEPAVPPEPAEQPKQAAPIAEPPAEQKPEPPAQEAPTPASPDPVPAEPVQPPDSPASPPAPEPEPPQATEPTSIPVTDQSSDSQKTENDSSAVTPNLAQALADEEKAVQDKIDDFAAKPVEDIQPVANEPTLEEQATPATAPEQAEDSSEDKKSLLDDKPSKKVIKPINDLSKQPDINELVAKEEAKESAGGLTQANQVIKPQSSTSTQTDQTQSSSSDDDFGKISL